MAKFKINFSGCVTDCGQVVNPDGARNQLEGGMIMAASELIASTIPDAHLVTMPVVHLSNVERPDEFEAVLSPFLGVG